MAINKTIILDRRATPITYWRYLGFANLDNINKEVVISLGGYSTLEARQAADGLGLLPDAILSFKITNAFRDDWVERPLTSAEKTQVAEEQNIALEEVNETTSEIVRTELPHFDIFYQALRQSIATNDSAIEKAAAYIALQSCASYQQTFANATQV